MPRLNSRDAVNTLRPSRVLLAQATRRVSHEVEAMSH